MLDRNALVGWLSQELNISDEEINQQQKLYSTGLLNSFKILKLVRFIESQQNKTISSEKMEVMNFESVDSILNKVVD